MVQVSSHEVFEDGQVIFDEDSHGDWVYIIEKGVVELSKIIGGKRLILDTLQAGDVFGEVGYITMGARTATATARGTTELGVVDRSFLDDELSKLSGSFRSILKGMAQRLQRTTTMLAHEKIRREEPRIRKVFGLTFKDKESLVKAYSENLSGLGVYIKTPNPLPKGTRFNLKLNLPDDEEALRIGCEVAWIRNETDDPSERPIGMGVKFIQISKEGLQRLREALKDSEEEVTEL